MQIEEKLDDLTSHVKWHVDTVTSTTEKQKDKDRTGSGKGKNY